MPDKPDTVRVAEISARSQKSFEDAAVIAIESVGDDHRSNVISAFIKEQMVEPDGDEFWYRVIVLVSVKIPAGKPLML